MNLMPAHPWVTIRNAIFEPDMWSLPTEIRHAATWEPWKRKRRSKTHKISVGTGTWRDFWSWNRRLNRRDGETLRVRGQRAVPQGRPGERVRQVSGSPRRISCDFVAALAEPVYRSGVLAGWWCLVGHTPLFSITYMQTNFTRVCGYHASL